MDTMMGTKKAGRRANGDTKDTSSVKKKIIPYWILAAVRIILTLLPQTGYIHPDEYFQSIEVIAGDHFDIDVYKPWEFNVTFPLRTALLPQLAVGIPYSIVDILSPHYSHMFGKSLKTPYILLLLPRLAMCCLSFVSDYCLYKICIIYSQNYRVRLITYASSYVMLTYATRTFSNTIELVLSSLLLYYVSRCMAFSEKVVLQSDHFAERYDKARTIGERVKYYKLRASLPYHSLNHCLIIATITVVGIFNRPTFVVFAFPPIFFWLQRGLGSRSVGLLDFHIRIISFIFCGIPAALFLIITDSFYFGYLTLGEIFNLDIGMDNFVVTPVNFLKYNMDEKNLASHGLHPRFVHFAVNVPLLFNVLGIVGLLTFARMIYSMAVSTENIFWSLINFASSFYTLLAVPTGFKGRWLELPRIQSIEGLMTASFIVPIAALSIIPHQEPRFIIPTLLPLIFLHAQTIGYGTNTATVVYTNNVNSTRCYYTVNRSKEKISKLQYLWLICNLALTIFYGFAHQGGVFPLASHMAAELRAKPYLTHLHLYTSYTYSVPTALLQLRNTRKTYMSSDRHKYRLNQDFYLYEQGSNDVSQVYESIASKIDECERKLATKRVPYRLYYALPVSFLPEFEDYAAVNGSQLFQYKSVVAFYPHVVTEKFPSLDTATTCVLAEGTNGCFKDFVENMSRNIYEFARSFGLLLLKIEVVKPSDRLIS